LDSFQHLIYDILDNQIENEDNMLSYLQNILKNKEKEIEELK